jgi:uncharacterized membrane protein YgaE (UPF0421/DUF939 family)
MGPENMTRLELLSAWDIAYSINMAIACLISYWTMTNALAPLVGIDTDYLGGMWATVATVFVFRDTRKGSLSAGVQRFIATCVSFALCQLYLWVFPFEAIGMAALLGIGTLIMMKLRRREEIVTTAITTAVVMVVAAMDARHARLQPLLRLLDTIVGISIGIGAKWVASRLFYSYAGKPVR